VGAITTLQAGFKFYSVELGLKLTSHDGIKIKLESILANLFYKLYIDMQMLRI